MRITVRGQFLAANRRGDGETGRRGEASPPVAQSPSPPISRSSYQASIWLILAALAGAAMAFLFDDSCQQDGGLHFLFAKWAWTHEELFVGVWSRPLFTSLYAFPALIGYRAARLFTVLICLVVSWQTWRLAEDQKVERAPLAIALIWLQPSFFLFSADNMTEPVFALVYSIALRLHLRGHLKTGMAVASLMILARPEGFFLGLLWGIWALKDLLTIPSSSNSFRGRLNFRSLSQVLLLAAGSFIWWLAALALTRDPLFIKHNWPSNWPVTGTIYGAAGLYAYPVRLLEIVGFFLFPVFIYGLYDCLKHRLQPALTSTFLLFFILHTILRAYGLLGSAGYPRYLVAISPATALITLAGWNQIARLFAHMARPVRAACAAIVIGTSAYANFVYADGAEWSRDARALTAAYQWFKSRQQSNPTAINRLVWCQPFSAILFDRDPWENLTLTRDRQKDIQLLRESTAGTLVVWDARVGPKWFGLQASDFEEAGYLTIYSQDSILGGYILDRSWFGYGGPRRQVIYLMYKPNRHVSISSW